MELNNGKTITQMMRWLSAVAILFYLGLLVTPQVANAHALHLAPLADNPLQAINPLSGQLNLSIEQDGGDDNDNSLQPTPSKTQLYLSPTLNMLPAAVALPQLKAAHPVRAPPFYSST